MIAVIKKSEIKGVISAPPSKSALIRRALAAALSGEPITANGGSFDARAAIDCAYALHQDLNACFDVGGSATLLRLLLPILGALGRSAVITYNSQLALRNNTELFACLSTHGQNLTVDDGGVTTQGRLKSGEYSLSCQDTSGVLSGLLMALPLLDGDSGIKVAEKGVSQGYADMTLRVLADYGIRITAQKSGYLIEGGQVYQPTRLRNEGDWSSGAVMLTLGALCGKISVNGLTDSQPDDYVIKLIPVQKEGEGVWCAQKTELAPIRLDCAQTPDLVFAATVIACFVKGESVFYNTERLCNKETDRRESAMRLAYALGAKVVMERGSLHIIGGDPQCFTFDCEGDHRAVTAAAVAAAAVGGKLLNAEGTEKSWSGFWQDFAEVGGDYAILK